MDDIRKRKLMNILGREGASATLQVISEYIESVASRLHFSVQDRKNVAEDYTKLFTEYMNNLTKGGK